MEITLEKIELVKDRTGVSYKEAKEALEKAKGSVVDAIIDIEETIDESGKGKMSEGGLQLVEKLKELVRKGNASRIIIKRDGDVVLNLPLNIGIIGTVFATWQMVVAVLVAFGTKCEIELVKDDGSIIDISEMTNENLENLVEKGVMIADEVKEKSSDVYKSVRNKTVEALNKVKSTDDFDMSEDDDYEDCCCGEDVCCECGDEDEDQDFSIEEEKSEEQFK